MKTLKNIVSKVFTFVGDVLTSISGVALLAILVLTSAILISACEKKSDNSDVPARDIMELVGMRIMLPVWADSTEQYEARVFEVSKIDEAGQACPNRMIIDVEPDSLLRTVDLVDKGICSLTGLRINADRRSVFQINATVFMAGKEKKYRTEFRNRSILDEFGKEYPWDIMRHQLYRGMMCIENDNFETFQMLMRGHFDIVDGWIVPRPDQDENLRLEKAETLHRSLYPE